MPREELEAGEAGTLRRDSQPARLGEWRAFRRSPRVRGLHQRHAKRELLTLPPRYRHGLNDLNRK